MGITDDFLNDDGNIVERYPEMEPAREFKLRKAMECADGFTMSVQATYGHYCRPRVSDATLYEAVEVGYPSEPDALLTPFAECPEGNLTQTVYGYVPVTVVDEVVAKHGGLVSVKDQDA